MSNWTWPNWKIVLIVSIFLSMLLGLASFDQFALIITDIAGIFKDKVK